MGRRREERFVMGGLAAAAAGEGDLDLWMRLVEPLRGGGEPVGFGDGLRERVSREVDR
jgi:hypothetical protein